jgi:hypothetical protein
MHGLTLLTLGLPLPSILAPNAGWDPRSQLPASLHQKNWLSHAPALAVIHLALLLATLLALLRAILRAIQLALLLTLMPAILVR